MEYNTLLWLGLFALGYALLAERIARGPLTLPLVAVTIGLVARAAGATVPVDLTRGPFAHVTLALLLFAGGARLRPERRRTRHREPLRLLLVALPGSLLLGTALGVAIFPGLSIEAAGVMAAALAATDTGLCAPALRPPGEGDPVSRDLRFEEGLSDGLAVAFVDLALGARAFEGRPVLSWLAYAAHHLGLAVSIGVGVGLAGGWLVQFAQRRVLVHPATRALAGGGLAIVALAAAGGLGASGPTAAFVAGLTVARVAPQLEKGIAEIDPWEGNLLFVLAFVTLGASVVTWAIERASWRTAAYVAASLTVVRAVPVFASFVRSRSPPRDVAYVAWFGPRGLAAILTARALIEHSDVPGRQVALVTIATTVAASVLLHGITAAPLARLRARRAPEGASPARRATAQGPLP